MEITKFDDHLQIPNEVKVQDFNRLLPLHLSDAFDFQLQLSDLVKEFPPHTMAQIKTRPPLISFKANKGVFEDEDPLTIQQFPYAELYDNKDNNINELQHVNTQNDELQHIDTQGEEVQSVHTILAHATNDDPAIKHEENEDISIDPINHFYVTRNEPVGPHYNQGNSTKNL